MTKMKKLPGRTVERLSAYRRTLLAYSQEGHNYIYSHELANLLHITAVQVRRDLMLIGHASVMKKGYDIKSLINEIGSIIDSDEGQNVAVVGIGNLGRAITRYFVGKRSKLNIVAALDTDPQKINKSYSGVKCYPMEKIEEIVTNFKVSIVILTVPPTAAKETAELCIKNKIKGILNFTSVNLNTPANVHLEEYDMITSLEKVAYFVKNF